MLHFLIINLCQTLQETGFHAPPDIDPPLDPELVEPLRSGRTSQAPDIFSPDMYDSTHNSLIAQLFSISIPSCYSQTVKDVRWINATNGEL